MARCSVKDRSPCLLLTLSAGAVMVDLFHEVRGKREIGFLGRPVRLRANDHLVGPLARFAESLALTASTCPISISSNTMLTGPPLASPWALGPCLGPDMPPRAQPNHMVPTLADTEGSSLNSFRKGACSPKFDCMACPGADERASKAIALPSTYLIFLFSFLRVLYSQFLGDFASRTFVSGVYLPPPSFVLSQDDNNSCHSFR